MAGNGEPTPVRQLGREVQLFLAECAEAFDDVSSPFRHGRNQFRVEVVGHRLVGQANEDLDIPAADSSRTADPSKGRLLTRR